MKLRKGWKLTFSENPRDVVYLTDSEYQWILHNSEWGKNGFKNTTKERVFILRS